MIDIHSHILPCVDDGSNSLETSRKLLLQYASQGVDRAICTPHQNKILRRADILRREFDKFSAAVADLPVRVYLGAEILYYSGMVNDIAKGELLTLGGSEYVLVEFPVMISGEDLQDAVYELILAKYVPIIAHIERYSMLIKEDYAAVRNAGALIQINAAAFNGRDTAKTAKYLLKNGLVDFIASDCHDLKHRDVNFAAAKEYVAKKFPEQFDRLFINL
ncbi:MAG: tyrosine-protein phosphatase [Candidatus Coproplasma sp.]